MGLCWPGVVSSVSVVWRSTSPDPSQISYATRRSPETQIDNHLPAQRKDGRNTRIFDHLDETQKESFLKRMSRFTKESFQLSEVLRVNGGGY